MNLMKKKKKIEYKKNKKKYFIGLILSITLTIVSFLITTNITEKKNELKIFFIISLLIFQIFVQLFYFLNTFLFSKEKWIFTSLLFTILINFIIIFGSIWIMNNLNSNMNLN